MIPLDHELWLNLNGMVVKIHSVASRGELADLVTASLPATLCAEEACWSEHGPEEPGERENSPDSFRDEVLALVLARTTPKHDGPPANGARQNGSRDANHGVFDLSSLISNRLRHQNAFLNGNPRSGTGHHLVTQFFIDARRGVLLTVRNSSAFTDKQKFTLSLLREHLAIAARRQDDRESTSVAKHSILGDTMISRREMEVLPCLVQGMTNPEIAHALGISPRTVEKHVASILDKAGLDNRRMLIGLGVASKAKTFSIKNG